MSKKDYKELAVLLLIIGIATIVLLLSGCSTRPVAACPKPPAHLLEPIPELPPLEPSSNGETTVSSINGCVSNVMHLSSGPPVEPPIICLRDEQGYLICDEPLPDGVFCVDISPKVTYCGSEYVELIAT